MGLIDSNEFGQMKTFDKTYDGDFIKMLDLFVMTYDKVQKDLVTTIGLFDKFKNIASLEESFCVIITAWTRQQFQSFASYITCLRDTAGRTKEQLIAIYRYWLSKGIDQSTLSMLKSNTTQQQMTRSCV